MELTTTTAAATAGNGGSSTSTDQKKLSPADFMFGTTLGEGAYARVVLGKKKSSGEEFAVKIMEKRFIKKEKKVKFVMMERKVFSRVSHPRIVKLFFTFQDTNYLYMVMELCRGGELLSLILKNSEENKKKGVEDVACSLSMTTFYIAEIVQALEYLHTNKIIHRDLKPENILFNDTGHIKITDFGTAKDESPDSDSRANTFCGTAEYVSPEVLRDHEASRGCDIWALGCMVFQMLVGRPMFRGDNEYLTFQLILTHDPDTFEYPLNFPEVAKQFCNALLQQEPSDRLGADVNTGYDDLKAHPFFAEIDWNSLGKTKGPYVPPVSDLPPADADGATDDWVFAGVATELQIMASKSPREVLQSSWSSANLISTKASAKPVIAAAVTDTSGASSSQWNRFLTDDECVRFCGLVSKRKGLFSKKRQLILTSKPRLIYVDPNRMKQKGEIPWTGEMYVQLKNSTAFDIVTRVYHITDTIVGAQKWADAINQVLFDTRK